jgi:hypothetical protein
MDDDLVYSVLPFVVIVVLGAGFWVLFRQRAAARRARSPRVVEPDLATPVRDRRTRRGLRERLRRKAHFDPRSIGHAKRGPLGG